jgi:hypothetical protein
MCEKFIDELVVKLNENCLNKDSVSNIKWSTTDVNLDIAKCRNHCVISTGYVWNGSELCDNCNKTLHENLDKLNKSQFELAVDLINSNNKINSLNDEINKLNDKLVEVLKFVDTMKAIIDKNTNSIDSMTNSITKYNSLQSLVIENNDTKYMDLIKGEQKYLDTINGKLDDFINIFDKKVENIITKKFNINYNNNNNNNINNNINNINNNINKIDNINNNINKIDNINNNKYANIKIFNIHKEGGLGIILTSNTISTGKVRRGYSYQNHKGTVIFKIKDFENNFCPTEFEYPDTGILIIAQFMKGDYKMVDLYDEFYCIETK